MDWESVLIGNLIGGGISLAVSTLFYVLAARGLKEEAAHLRRLNISLIHLLQNAGVIEVKEFDRETGEPIRWSVGSQVELRWRVDAPSEETGQEESNEERC
jgi:hypothetical protein